MMSPTQPYILPDLWSGIIGSLSPPSNSMYVPDEEELERIGALKACATVCQEWTPYAQKQLYSIAWVCSGAALWRLIRTLSSQPQLIPLIVRVVATPQVWESLDDPINDYLPLIPLLSIDAEYGIDHIQLANFTWSPQLYEWQYFQGFHNQSVTRLEVIGAMLSSLADFLPFIHSLDNLTHLVLIGILLGRQETEQELMLLETLPSSYASKSLRSLKVGQGTVLSGINLFGNRIACFHLVLQLGAVVPPSIHHYYTCLSHYSDLTTLSLTFEPWMTLRPPLAGSVDEGEKVWSPIHRGFLDALYAVTSPIMRLLEITLIPQQQEPLDAQNMSESEDGMDKIAPWNLPYYYRHSREGMMDALFTREVREIILGPVFSDLAVIKLVVCENVRTEDDFTRWTTAVSTRVGLRPEVVRVDIRYHLNDSKYKDLWK